MLQQTCHGSAVPTADRWRASAIEKFFELLQRNVALQGPPRLPTKTRITFMCVRASSIAVFSCASWSRGWLSITRRPATLSP